MNLFIRTLQSFNRRERALGSILSAVFLISFLSILFPSLSFLPGTGEAVYSEGVVGEITHLSPIFTEFSEADGDISSLLFSGLAKYNAATGDFDEDMATHTLSEDKLTYTFTLKNNLYWHDGQPVTADDIFYTFATVIQSPDFENPILKSNFDGVKIEQVDSRTVTFTLNSPNSFFFTALTVGILPKHILEDIPVADLDTDPFNQVPVGTGPYKVTGPYEVGDDGSTFITLTAFPQYYGEKPSIEKIRFVAYPTIESLIANRSVWNGAARIRQSTLNDMNLKNLVTYQYELPQYTALFFNTDSTFLNQNKERLGMSKAIDKDEILKTIAYKVRIDTPLLELSQEEWIYSPDVSEAAGALFDAGWSLEEGAQVRTNEDGDKLSIRLVRRDFSNENTLQEETSQITADLIQEQLAAVGVEVVIEEYPLSELASIIKNRDYDLLLYGQSLGYNLDTFAYWHSSQTGEAGLNFSNYQNPNADVLIEKIRASFDNEEKKELLESLGETLAEDVPAVFLYTPSYYYVVDTDLTGINFRKLLLPKDRFSTIASWKF